jgi:hypothetical protein
MVLRKLEVVLASPIKFPGTVQPWCFAMASERRMYGQHRDVFSETHTLITFDQRGFGDSDHLPFLKGSGSAYTVERV